MATGGDAGAGGAGGAGDGWAFGTDAQGWSARAVSTSATFSIDDVQVTWSPNGGDAGGTLIATIAFDAADQFARVGVDSSATPLDLTGRTVTARVELDSGFTATGDLTAKLYVTSGDAGVLADGPSIALSAEGQWFTLSFDADNPFSAETNFDAGDIRELGVQIDTSSSSTNAGSVTIFIDSVDY